MSVQYRVYVTPLYSQFVYADEVEISDKVENISGEISSSIDSTDFSVGIFTFNDVQIVCDNSDGVFSPSQDSRSIFTYSRDRAKVRIVFDQGDGSPVTTYFGVVNDPATGISSDTDEVQLTILGPDSVLIRSQVAAGAISTGMTITQAMVAVLNTGDIRIVLGISLSNINPQNDITIDDGTKFDGLNKKDALIKLLSASNSVMLIDSDQNVIIRDRRENTTNDTIYLYGRGDQFGRDNIISISNYNTGLQRVFNSCLVTGGQPSASVNAAAGGTVDVAQNALVGSGYDSQSQGLYGLRQKALTLDFISTQVTLDAAAQSYADEFAFAKTEFEVTVPTDVVASAILLDLVSVNYPLFIRPSGKFLPVIGVTVIGDTDSPLPYTKGAVSINPYDAYKIIAKTEDISTYETTLKLRQIGTTLYDGMFSINTEDGESLQTEDSQNILVEAPL